MTENNPHETNWPARGFRDAFGLSALMIVATMLGVGGLARDIGYPVWAANLSTLLVWAGPAQVILFGGVASGAAMPAIALAIMVSSMRFLPMTVSILPLAKGNGSRWWQMALAAHLVSLTTWVEGLRRLPKIPHEGRMGYFLGFGACIIGSGTLATHCGYYLYGAVATPVAAGLLFMSPIFFTAAIVRGAQLKSDWAAVVLGLLLAPAAFMFLPSGVDLLAVGVCGGTVAFAIRRRELASRSEP